MNTSTHEIGRWSFILGVLIAIVVGILSSQGESVMLVSLLIILGFIVGLLNVQLKETTEFLIAGVALVIVSQMAGSVVSSVPIIGPFIQAILASILIFVLPATIMVAVRKIYALERD